MREALQELMKLIDEQILVRNIEDDKDVMKFFKQGVRIARVLKMAQMALEESK